MTEAGGSTTQSGILYQNSVAVLYLGRLLDVSNRPDIERVEQVRVEAPTDVDDTVVTFADRHRTYIQSKEHLRGTSSECKNIMIYRESANVPRTALQRTNGNGVYCNLNRIFLTRLRHIFRLLV
jgi:hypothetical protein